MALTLCSVLCLSLTACAGRTANPIAAKEVTDKEMDCPDLIEEMSDLERKARRLRSEQSSKMVKNVALALFPPAWILLNLGDAERQEASAMQDRYAHLQRISRKKDCE